jgi:hypothetical protein
MPTCGHRRHGLELRWDQPGGALFAFDRRHRCLCT